MATDNTFMRLLGITRANQAQNVTDLMNAAIDYMEQGGHTTVATVKVGVLRALMNEYLTPDQLKKLGPNCLNAFKKRLKIVRKLRKNPPSENAPKKRTKKAKEEVEILDQDLTEEMVDEPEEVEKQISYVVENVEEPQEEKEEEEEEEILLLINEEEREEENPDPELFTEEVVEIDGPQVEENGGPVQEVEYEVHADPSLSLEEQVVELKTMLTDLTRDFNEREAQHQVREQELLQEINLLKSQMNIREQLED